MRPQKGLTEKQKEQLASMEKQQEEIVVKWVNKYGVPMDIKTRRGGLIHALWMAEHEKRSRKRLAEANEPQPHIVQALDIETEVIPCQNKQLLDENQRNP
jgi:hypothetical protein